MKQRSPIAVLLLSIVTLGIYSWYWLVKTKGEMNKLGESVPTAWIWLIPFVGTLWWLWRYSEAVEHVTHEKASFVMSFLLLLFLGTIGQAIIQDYFNKNAVAMSSDTAYVPEQPVSAAPTEQPAEPNNNQF